MNAAQTSALRSYKLMVDQEDALWSLAAKAIPGSQQMDRLGHQIHDLICTQEDLLDIIGLTEHEAKKLINQVDLNFNLN